MFINVYLRYHNELQTSYYAHLIIHYEHFDILHDYLKLTKYYHANYYEYCLKHLNIICDSLKKLLILILLIRLFYPQFQLLFIIDISDIIPFFNGIIPIFKSNDLNFTNFNLIFNSKI